MNIAVVLPRVRTGMLADDGVGVLKFDHMIKIAAEGR